MLNQNRLDELDQYVTQVERRLRLLPPEQRAQEARELQAHLAELTRGYEELGETPEEATARALQQFGSPSAVGRGLILAFWRNRLVGETRNLFLPFVSMLALCGAVHFAGEAILSRWQHELLDQGHRLITIVASLCEFEIFLFPALVAFLLGSMLRQTRAILGIGLGALAFGQLVVLAITLPQGDHVSIDSDWYTRWTLWLILSATLAAALGRARQRRQGKTGAVRGERYSSRRGVIR